MTNNIRENLQKGGIEHISFSSMKELINNEALFLKHYIKYEWDDMTYIATIIGKSCHHGVEHFLEDEETRKLYEKDPKNIIDLVVKMAKDYAKEEYVAKYRKPSDFWTATTMANFGGYTDIVKLVDKYKSIQKEKEELTVFAEMQLKEKEQEEITKKINTCIAKHKKKDEKLDDCIRYGATGTIEKIFDGIENGLNNWFSIVYPKVKELKLVATEYNRTMDVCDANGVILELPVKFIVDGVFEDKNGDIIIIDWKFKGMLSNDESIKPDYDMQATTYYFGLLTAFEKKPKKSIFFEIQPSKQKAPYMQQPQLRKLCDENNIDWATGNNGKYMTNAIMQNILLEKGIIELAPVVYEYIVDFEEKPYLLDIWLLLYKQVVKRLYELLVDGDDFVANIFDQNFDGGVTVYNELLNDFKHSKEKESDYKEEDVVVL